MTTKEQDKVIASIEEQVLQKLTSSCSSNSCYEFAVETDNWFSNLSEQDKATIKYIGCDKHDEFCDNRECTTEYDWDVFENEKTHEVLHILAHTINEQAVEKRRLSLLGRVEDEDSESISKMLILARALMLFVSKHQHFMLDCQKCLTCLATIYAEVGDFVSAKAQLLENTEGNYYQNKDVNIRAEIEFFYYIVSLMENPNTDDEKRTRFYNNYVNFCYNNFDYDALAQIEMYRFKYSIISAFFDGEQVSNNKAVLEKKLSEKHSEFSDFIDSMQAVFVSDWTRNEYDKIKVMFQFLAKYYSMSDYHTKLSKMDLAAKYLYLYAKSSKFRNSSFAPAYELSDSESIIKFLNDVFSAPNQSSFEVGQKIQIRNCVYSDIRQMSIPDQEEELRKMGMDSDSAYFVTVGLKDAMKNVYRNTWVDNDDTKVLQYFLINCAFDSVLYDLVNPQNIFLLVPLMTAEPLAYQLNSFDDLLLDVTPAIEKSFSIKGTQRNSIVRSFIDNYYRSFDTEWARIIMNTFDEVELVIWNDEKIGTVYAAERYYFVSRKIPEEVCYPLVNHSRLTRLFDDMINRDEISCIHDNCNHGNCRQLIINCMDERVRLVNQYLCLPYLSVGSLTGKKMIIKYDIRDGHWRIIVMNTSILPEPLKLLQAYLCDNKTYVDKNIDKLRSALDSDDIEQNEKPKIRRFVGSFEKQMEYASTAKETSTSP